jgi:hypothetical protein
MKLPHEQPGMLMNRSIPSSVVIPVLEYPDVREAVDWLCRTFGFVERLRLIQLSAPPQRSRRLCGEFFVRAIHRKDAEDAEGHRDRF